MKHCIDLNADVGELPEERNHDAALMPYITSCNIACGGHAGSEAQMRTTVRLAMRHGVRIGTAEIYRSLALLPEVDDSLIVNLDLPGGKFFMPLFVKLKRGIELDEALRERIRATLRREYSPRHVPDKIYKVEGIPFTLTGKKMEVPVRKILMGVALEKAANRDAVANPQALDYFSAYARNQTDYSLTA